MGSGKSTVGRKLANRLKMNFIDLDARIESVEDRSIADIFSVDGEDYFRKIESEVLRSDISSTGTIISCGGGTPCFHDNMEYMNNTGLTVYLTMDAAALVSRLKGSKKKRPLIAQLDDNELSEYVSRTLEAREKWYNKARFKVSGLSPDIIQLSSLLQAPDPYNP